MERDGSALENLSHPESSKHYSWEDATLSIDLDDRFPFQSIDCTCMLSGCRWELHTTLIDWHSQWSPSLSDTASLRLSCLYLLDLGLNGNTESNARKDLILLLIFFLRLVGAISSKSLRLRHFKSDRDEIWQVCASNKYASIDGVGFLMWRHNFKVASMTSFCAEKTAI